MALCALCGLQLFGNGELCPHHHTVSGDDWHVSNRIMCAFFHRGTAPARLSCQDREDTFWAHVVEGG